MRKVRWTGCGYVPSPLSSSFSASSTTSSRDVADECRRGTEDVWLTRLSARAEEEALGVASAGAAVVDD